MRIRIAHTISYAYAEPARQITQILRLTPRDHDGQHVMSWRIEPNVDGRMKSRRDAFGNIVHTFSADGPFSALAIAVTGLVETTDLAGVVRGAVERVPADVFGRDTLLTTPDEALKVFAEEATRAAGSPLSRMHALMHAVHEAVTCRATESRVGLGAAKALQAREGIAQDMAHVFMTCARHLGQPARYVSGYVAEGADLPQEPGAHAWAEAHVEGYGWIGFDCCNDVCPIDTHIRVATGLDYADAAPVRGARQGGEGENLTVTVSATAAEIRPSNQ